MAVDIKKLQGAHDYLTGIRAALTPVVLGYSRIPEITSRFTGSVKPYRATAVHVPPHRVPNLSPTARATLRREFPAIYDEVVTVTPPPRKYGVRLDVQPGLHRRSSEEWAAAMEQGRAETEAAWGWKYADADWNLRTTNVHALHAVTAERLRLTERIENRRVELAEFIEEYELPERMYGYGDGSIRAVELGESEKVDTQAVLAHAETAHLVTYRKQSGYDYVRFTEVKPDKGDPDEDGFEGD